MKKYILMLSILFVLFITPLTSFAFSKTSVEQINKDILYTSVSSIFNLNFIKPGITKPEISITYKGRVVRTDTNAILTTGDSVPSGTTLNFIPEPYLSSDASYRDTGSLGGSVDAQWVTNAAFPQASFARQNTSSCLAGDFLHSRTKNTSFTLGPFMCIFGGRLGTGCAGGTTFTTKHYIGDYPPFSINPPVVSIEHNGSAGLSCTNNNSVCTVTSTGSINSNFVFAQTFGKFYYMYTDSISSTVPGLCRVDSTLPLESGSLIFSLFGSSTYSYNVPETKINVALVASAAPQCGDGIDNDGDGNIDYPADSDCSSSGGTSEGVYTPPPPPPPVTQCSDGIDNNGNGYIDYPDDPACESALDNNEEVLAPASISLVANPRLVAADSTTSIIWTAESVEDDSCTLTGTNGDSWNLTGIGGNKTTSLISQKTTFTLRCTDLEGDAVSESLSVITAPKWKEI